MAIQILMPALSPTMEEGTLSKWLVKEGDKVNSGDILAEIETDKATMEFEAIDEGIVAKILVQAGSQGVKVNSVLAILAQEGEKLENISNVDTKTSAVSSDAVEKTTVENPVKQEPAVTTSAAAAALSSVSSGAANANKIFASPLARRIAKDNGLALENIKGTGPNGRIVKADVELALKQPKSVSKAVSLGVSDDEILSLYEAQNYELVPHDGMRKTIAKRLLESKLTVPHFYLTIDCNLDNLLALRQEINAAAPVTGSDKDAKPAYKVSVNDMVLRAVALSLRDLPAANVSWLEHSMIQHKHVDVGVAVAIEGGLITPILRAAETKSLVEISQEVKSLVKRARERKLKPMEYQGGTTSVSNLGMFGVKNFSAIVNPPQSTIFAIGAGEKRPVIVDNKVEVSTVMSVTISSDHRSVDGALAAELAQIFKGYIEKPLSLLL